VHAHVNLLKRYDLQIDVCAGRTVLNEQTATRSIKAMVAGVN
jgi:hypothetical protein